MLTFGRPNLGALPAFTALQPAATTMVNEPLILEPTPGQCSSDGKFVWIAATATVPAHWDRAPLGYSCPSLYSGSPTIRTGGGGVTVTKTPSFRTLTHKENVLQVQRNAEAIKRLVAIAPTLPPCPASARDEKGVCYDKTPVVPLTDRLLPPGTFTVFGVPFHISELTDKGHFEKNAFVPDAEQRFMLDMAILNASHNKYKDIGGLPIEMIQKNKPDIAVNVPGFSLNPVQPTNEEMTQPGGWDHWIARGGYPISLSILRGQEKVTSSPMTIATCGSISCGCPADNASFDPWRQSITYPGWTETFQFLEPDQQVNVWPACIGMGVGSKGLTSTLDYNEVGWNAYVAMNEANPKEYYLVLAIQEAAWTAKMAGWIGSQLEKLAGLFCAAMPSVQQQLTTSLAEKCVDKQQKPCTKGSAGCTCTKPPAIQPASVSIFGTWANYWCGKFQEENKVPVYEAPEVPQVPPELTQPQKAPWWQWGLIAGAGVAAGAYFFSRR